MKTVRLKLAHVPGSIFVLRWLVVRGSEVMDVAATKRAAMRRASVGWQVQRAWVWPPEDNRRAFLDP